jgi:hypothetical protein
MSTSSCGGSDSKGLSEGASAPFLGVYELVEAKKNAAACSTEGAVPIADSNHRFFIAYTQDVLGAEYIATKSCPDIASCTACLRDSATCASGTIDFFYMFGKQRSPTELGGFEANTGVAQGASCVNRIYSELSLLLGEPGNVRIEVSTKRLADQPKEDNACVVRPMSSQLEAAILPCSEFTVYEGTLVP